MISMDKQYKTRDGRDVSLYAIGVGSENHIHGAVKNYDGSCIINWWYYDGSKYLGKKSDLDLVEIKPIKISYVNIYPQGFNGWHRNKKEAEEYASPGRIACIKVTYTEGQFDD